MKYFYRIRFYSYPSMQHIRSIDVQTVPHAVWQVRHAESKGFATTCAVMPAGHPDEDRLHSELCLALTGKAALNNADVVIAGGVQ